MKQFFELSVCIFSLLLISGCADSMQGAEEKKIQMPEIVFAYTFMYDTGSEETYQFRCIDREGNVYAGDSEKYFCKTEALMEFYDNLESDPDCERVKTITMEEVQEKYNLLRQIQSGKQNEVTLEEAVIDVYQGQKKWNGYCYDKKDGLVCVTLEGDGDRIYTNQDPEAAELADWLDQVFGEASGHPAE